MIGKILGGRYELLEKIGIGGMAIVYRAKCLLLNRTVAVKVLRDDLDSSDEFLKRFNIEAQSAASLTNQHIVSIYDVGKDGNVNYIVMEYVEGETLKEYIKEHKMIEWKEAVKIAMGIADALSEAHKKHIVHRDIKPHNIIVTNDGDIKVTDFGIARVSSGATISVDGDVLGSVHYLSPEQARGGYVDERSDIYSLGVVMYEMLTGKVPFDGDTPVAVAMKQIEQLPVPPTELVSGIPQNVSAIVLKAMCKETSGRYATVTELFDDLSKVLSDPDTAVIETNDNNDIMDEATKKIPALKIDNMILDIESGKMVKDTDKSVNSVKSGKPKKMDKNDKKAVIGAVATSLVIVILLSVFAASMIFPDFKPFGFLGAFSNREAEVPKLIDLTLEQAEDLIKDTDFSIVVQGDETSGVITEQYPHPGRRVKGSYSIEVVLGDGGEAIKLKDYRNKDYKNAENELRKLGLDVVVERQNSDDIAVDHIISQSPGKNASLNKGDTVTLFVSDGVSDGEIVVPNFIGMSKADAKRRIEQENLVVGTFDYADSSKPKDTVIKQSINAGDSAKEKDVINLVLSNGQGGGSNTGTSEKKSRILTYYLPTDKTEVTVKLTENGKKIYEGIAYPKKNSVFEYTVNGPSDAVYEFYVDGKKLGN